MDNASNEQARKNLEHISKELNIHLILNTRNLGVATALNQGARCAIGHGYKWVLTFDQDTTAQENMLSALREIYDSYEQKTKIAVIGSNYIDEKTNTIVHPISSDRKKTFKEVKTVITSGSLVSLEIYQKIGGFRDEFFIDAVDHEYCLKARHHGYKVLLSSMPLMKHPVGENTVHIPWLKLHIFNHSALRRYFMARNGMILSLEYLLRDPCWALSRLFRLIASIIVMCFHGGSVPKKLKYALLGIVDGILRNTQREII
ncbi:MAG TPA: glycosyltransferase family 2 protein [Candidatus Omnitrophota bacterium]|nr:glycosyltransferase family 2 protein [Candidatus Omnitrophota bacterium]